jgi:2Fe-2S ferredoxin
MISITFIESDGTPHTVDAEEGKSLMQAAVNHNVPGIDADCGGAMTCGTCRICLPPEARDTAAPRTDLEQQMLAFSGLDGAGIRLSCQLIAGPAFDGLCVSIPKADL